MVDLTSKTCTKCSGTGPFPTKGLVCKACKSAYHHAYYVRHREKAIADARAVYEANRDEILAARKSRYATRTPDQIAERYEYNRTYYAAGRDWHLDHVKPLSRGGSHMLSNIRPACRFCNISKKDKWYGVAELHRFVR